MISSISKIPILIADNDKEDCYLIEKAFRENKISNPVATGFQRGRIDRLSFSARKILQTYGCRSSLPGAFRILEYASTGRPGSVTNH